MGVHEPVFPAAVKYLWPEGMFFNHNLYVFSFFKDVGVDVEKDRLRNKDQFRSMERHFASGFCYMNMEKNIGTKALAMPNSRNGAKNKNH